MRNARAAVVAFMVTVAVMGVVPWLVTAEGTPVGATECGPWVEIVYVPGQHPGKNKAGVVTGEWVEAVNSPTSRSRGNLYADGALLGSAPVEGDSRQEYPLPEPGTYTITGGDDIVSVMVRGCSDVEDTTTTTTKETTTTAETTTTGDTTTTTAETTTTGDTTTTTAETTTTSPVADTTTTTGVTTTVTPTTAPPSVSCEGKTYYTHPDCPGYEGP